MFTQRSRIKICGLTREEDVDAAVAAAAPGLTGKVTLEFVLGPDGLADVGILEHSDVPMGPLSCFSAAVWEVEWPAPATGTLTVTYPFEFETANDPG